MLRKILAAAATAALAKKAYDMYQAKNGGKPVMDVGEAARQPQRRSVKAGPLKAADTSSPE
ncbi:MAG: hypothetical protein EOO28_12980 [Comamonadaceae bacterium]|nr:MAG: hypothetical protein EOO28_12980 [Comamonadaceae bacterium]